MVPVKRLLRIKFTSALMTFSLLKLIQLRVGHRSTLLDLTRVLKACLFEPMSAFMQKLARKQPSGKKRNRAPDYQTVYEFTERQVMAGDTDHLYDLTYDPLVL